MLIDCYRSGYKYWQTNNIWSTILDADIRVLSKFLFMQKMEPVCGRERFHSLTKILFQISLQYWDLLPPSQTIPKINILFEKIYSPQSSPQIVTSKLNLWIYNKKELQFCFTWSKKNRKNQSSESSRLLKLRGVLSFFK